MNQHDQLIEPLLNRLRTAGSGATYPLDPVERELVLDEVDRLRAEVERLLALNAEVRAILDGPGPDKLSRIDAALTGGKE